MKNSNENRESNPRPCSAVPQPKAPPRTPTLHMYVCMLRNQNKMQFTNAFSLQVCRETASHSKLYFVIACNNKQLPPSYTFFKQANLSPESLTFHSITSAYNFAPSTLRDLNNSYNNLSAIVCLYSAFTPNIIFLAPKS
jgi:hypothetical protein